MLRDNLYQLSVTVTSAKFNKRQVEADYQSYSVYFVPFESQKLQAVPFTLINGEYAALWFIYGFCSGSAGRD